MYRKIIFVLLLILLKGCVGLSKKDCETMNWYQKGKSDAMNGDSLNTYSKHEKSCSKFGLKANMEDYSKGHEDGLELFCTYDSAYQFGLEGNEYYNTCIGKNEINFMKGYKRGSKEYELKQKERELEEKEQELKEREENLKEKEEKSGDD
jgi:hypothetical protein